MEIETGPEEGTNDLVNARPDGRGNETAAASVQGPAATQAVLAT